MAAVIADTARRFNYRSPNVERFRHGRLSSALDDHVTYRRIYGSRSTNGFYSQAKHRGKLGGAGRSKKGPVVFVVIVTHSCVPTSMHTIWTVSNQQGLPQPWPLSNPLLRPLLCFWSFKCLTQISRLCFPSLLHRTWYCDAHISTLVRLTPFADAARLVSSYIACEMPFVRSSDCVHVVTRLICHSVGMWSQITTTLQLMEKQLRNYVHNTGTFHVWLYTHVTKPQQ